MTKSELFSQIQQKHSYLCIGLDTDIEKIPKELLKFPDPVFEFNKQIIDATKDLCVAYKLNTAFYEALGTKGWQAMEKTVNYIPKEIFKIADAKRGDIGNTSEKYAEAFFKTMNFDAITVAPYMGEDSVSPFFKYKNKWVILLVLTSNKGSGDFQKCEIRNVKSETLFERVIIKSQEWGTPENLMFVVGATHPEMFKRIREIAPDNFLLVPGVGAQGGDLEMISKYGMNKNCGLLVNSSRAIIYASSKNDFAEKAREEAMRMQKEMRQYLKKYLVK